MPSPFQGFPEQRRLLQAIAGGESPDYNVIYGGERFTDFSDHPRKAVPITSGPNKGKTSSAAGLYQFLAPTWDEVAGELGLKDFSEDSQNKAAWHLAAKTYEKKIGRDLLEDLRAGNTADIAPALKGVWTSIPGGIEPNKATGGFAGRLGAQAMAQTQGGGLLGASPAAAPMQIAPSHGLLGGLTSGAPGQPAGQGPGMGLNPMAFMGQQQQAPQQQEPEFGPASPMRRQQIDLTKLRAMINRPRFGRGMA